MMIPYVPMLVPPKKWRGYNTFSAFNDNTYKILYIGLVVINRIEFVQEMMQ